MADIITWWINGTNKILFRLIYDKTPWWFSIAAICFSFVSTMLGCMIPVVFAQMVKALNIDFPLLPENVMLGWGCVDDLVVLLFVFGVVTVFMSFRGDH